jgi:hypothetical protein
MSVQLVVDYLSGQTRHFEIPWPGWQLDHVKRLLIIGRGVPRTMVPLDSVAAFHLELTSPDSTATQMIATIDEH